MTRKYRYEVYLVDDDGCKEKQGKYQHLNEAEKRRDALADTYKMFEFYIWDHDEEKEVTYT